MDIEKLTKSQIVLLTLLISFVTSIATGIVTVSLMQQAPPAVAETVDRVIENTIETVATSTKSEAAAPVVTQQKTVVVDEADLIEQAVKQITPSVVSIYSDDGQQQFLGIGVVLDASGTVATDIGALGGRADATIQLQDGTQVRAFVTTRDQSSGLLYLTPATSTTASPTWMPAPISASDPELGEVVVAIGGQSTLAIAQGLVTQILPADTTTGAPEVIDTDVDASSVEPGSVLIDTNGNVLGVSTGISQASSPSGFIPASLLNENVTTSQS